MFDVFRGDEDIPNELVGHSKSTKFGHQSKKKANTKINDKEKALIVACDWRSLLHACDDVVIAFITLAIPKTTQGIGASSSILANEDGDVSIDMDTIFDDIDTTRSTPRRS